MRMEKMKMSTIRREMMTTRIIFTVLINKIIAIRTLFRRYALKTSRQAMRG